MIKYDISSNKTFSLSNKRKTSKGSTDFYPTPPWATRSLMQRLSLSRDCLIWEPAAGGRHLSDTMLEFVDKVIVSDAYDHGANVPLFDFLNQSFMDDDFDIPDADWVITNPPFNMSEKFIEQSLRIVNQGIAMLLRVQYVEGKKRYKNIFDKSPPTDIIVFSERLAMCRNKLDPNMDSMTSFAWFIWNFERRKRLDQDDVKTAFSWFPPGTKTVNQHDDDASIGMGYAPSIMSENTESLFRE